MSSCLPGMVPQTDTASWEMKIFVKAKPLAREEKVERVDSSHFVVAVTAPPRDGATNIAIAKALATHFKTSPSRVFLVSGFSSKQKVFETDDTV